MLRITDLKALVTAEVNEQDYSLERRRLMRWMGAATLVLPALTACANSNSSRYERTSSHITASDHRDGRSEHINIIGRTYRF
jgi:hypothetical protein